MAGRSVPGPKLGSSRAQVQAQVVVVVVVASGRELNGEQKQQVAQGPAVLAIAGAALGHDFPPSRSVGNKCPASSIPAANRHEGTLSPLLRLELYRRPL